MSTEKKATTKRDLLIDIQEKYQKIWEEEKLYEQTAGKADVKDKDKYFITFPYPYMNGRLHLGHAFSLTKAEFTARYQRMKGKHVLFPFSYHCTGQPIAAAAKKLERELKEFGNPPQFPEGVKGKQYNILKSMGISGEEIPKFTDPYYWLKFFPPYARADLKKFGAAIDHRRSFITTDINPYYDSFIRWQFDQLEKKKLLGFGPRFTIFSPLDNEPCADHDRASGEGVKPKEYTIVKLEVLKPLPKPLEKFGDFNIYLGAATLRPETMYGQTNCWLQPDGDYGLFRINEKDCLVLTKRAAYNLAFQNHSYEEKKVTCLAEFKGQELFGAACKAPYTPLEKIHVLPMFSVDCEKTTGVVTSVPSDSPDDYAALRDLQKKEDLRKKFGIKEEWVNMDLIEIIDLPEVGKRPAEYFCEKYKVESQNSKQQLEKAHDDCYKLGFAQGIMMKGKYAGKPVKEVKDLVKADLIADGLAIPYAEPEEKVVSRSGDQCVVALTDQWYIQYGQEEWKANLEKYLKTDFKSYNSQTLNELLATVDWLEKWGCSREFGLGTKLPCDENYLIESLSDSTIYMAFYTIAHLIQGGVLNGSQAGPSKIEPKQFNNDVWSYIFLDTEYPKTDIPKETLDTLRNEFRYWYPVDLRVSAKDLIKNHLTMFLYNHNAIWGNKYMPQSIFCNGYVMVDSEKMSKSLGNFLTMEYAIKEYGADASRFALADAGDTHQDANFERSTANAGIMKLYNFVKGCEELKNEENFRKGELNYFDKKFTALLQKTVNETVELYESLKFKDVLYTVQVGIHKIQNIYQLECEAGGVKPHFDMMQKAADLYCRMMAPICPHTMDYVWREIFGNKTNIFDSPFPESGKYDAQYEQEQDYFQNIFQNINRTLEKQKKGWAKKKINPNTLDIFVATEYSDWQKTGLSCLRQSYSEKDCFDKRFVAQFIKEKVPNKKQRNLVMGFINMKSREVEGSSPRNMACIQEELQFDGVKILSTYAPYVSMILGMKVNVGDAAGKDVPKNMKAKAVPGTPSFQFVEKKEE